MASDSRDVLARIDREKERYLEELKDYIRIPSISTDPDYKHEVLRAGDFLVGKMREAGLQTERIATAGGERPPRPSPGVRGVARRAGEAHGPLLRALRRAAGRPDRALAQSAVRAHGGGGQAGGALRHGRQGAVLRPPQGGGGDAGRAGEPAGQRQIPDRGGGGGGGTGD